MKVKNSNYINIQGWMVTDLHLKGNDLLIYAIIYGFTQDGEQWFEGSRQYLAEWCNSTTRGISKNLNSLVKKGHLIKEYVVINNVRFCKYKANINCSLVGNKVHIGEEQSSLPPREQSSSNNLDTNNLNNNNTYTRARVCNVSDVQKKDGFNLLWNRFVNLIGIKYRNPSKIEKEMITKWYQEFHLSDDLIDLAYEMCIDKKGEYSIKYMNGILTNWFNRGISTVDDAKQNSNKRKSSHTIETYENYDVLYDGDTACNDNKKFDESQDNQNLQTPKVVHPYIDQMKKLSNKEDFTNSDTTILMRWELYQFNEELVDYAYQNLISKNEIVNVKDMDRLLLSWYNNGIFTVEEAKQRK